MVSPSKRTKPIVRAVWVAGILLLVWLAGDGVYRQWIRKRYREWSARQEWDEDGIRKECRAFDLPAAGEDDAADSTGMLLVHGFADSPRSWIPVSRVLAERGIACRAMRLPGFGEAINGRDRDYPADWMAALAGEVADLKASHRRVFAAGHSMGGTLVLKFAMEHPDTLNGILLLTPLVQVSSERSPLLPPHIWFRCVRPLLRFTRFLENPFPVVLEDPGAARYLSRDRFIPIGIYEGLFDLLDDLADTPRPIGTDVLLITSGTDPVVNSARAEAFLMARRGEGIEHIQLERSGHPVQVDRHWREVAAAMARFARTHSGNDAAPL